MPITILPPGGPPFSRQPAEITDAAVVTSLNCKLKERRIRGPFVASRSGFSKHEDFQSPVESTASPGLRDPAGGRRPRDRRGAEALRAAACGATRSTHQADEPGLRGTLRHPAANSAPVMKASCSKGTASTTMHPAAPTLPLKRRRFTVRLPIERPTAPTGRVAAAAPSGCFCSMTHPAISAVHPG